MNSVGTPILWFNFAIMITGSLLIDIFLQNYLKKKKIIVQQDIICIFVGIILTLLFSLWLHFYLKETISLTFANQQVMNFLTGYVLEKALVVDNVFVWLMLFNYFSISIKMQHKILIYGIFGVVVLRIIIIFTGSWLFLYCHWIFYLFGIFLCFSGIKLFLLKEYNQSFDKIPIIRWLSAHLPMTTILHGDSFFVRQQGTIFVTPLIMVLILVGISDIIFALDSIPAIFSITTDTFIVLTSNLFALLGLRATYFVLSNISKKFFFTIKYGLSVILIFIGIKMLLIDILYITTTTSLIIIMVVLLLTMYVNYFLCRYKK
ncbi:Inner membrane protein alx [Candidatus Arsenophonus lipoptenae]|uniref:Inner membrane protein alx n=1 Tax=Candidatus Arsenophonus lipoptenae TaxID=634113 RepID=A0A0X9W6W1_9GAMM|nr:TerC/Alx family metal homeostasis membrane protein [Candidatus Arsenophonus lipoptenae]AMA65017.1 Inner membrane protein alx [Candidatus Arsenophonus lipoptenae]